MSTNNCTRNWWGIREVRVKFSSPFNHRALPRHIVVVRIILRYGWLIRVPLGSHFWISDLEAHPFLQFLHLSLIHMVSGCLAMLSSRGRIDPVFFHSFYSFSISFLFLWLQVASRCFVGVAGLNPVFFAVNDYCKMLCLEFCKMSCATVFCAEVVLRLSHGDLDWLRIWFWFYHPSCSTVL
jgi:hypothetical protein